MVDLSFRAIGMEVLAREGPVFGAGAAIQVYLARRVYRSGRYSIRSIAASASLALVGIAALGLESTLAAERLYREIGEGRHARLWQELNLYWHMVWPPVLAFGVAQFGLARYCRSEKAFLGVVVAAGALASWVVAMWLFTTVHAEPVLRLLLLPGGLGVVASLIGFTASAALWMVIGRWTRSSRPRCQPSSATGS